MLSLLLIMQLFICIKASPIITFLQFATGSLDYGLVLFLKAFPCPVHPGCSLFSSSVSVPHCKVTRSHLQPAMKPRPWHLARLSFDLCGAAVIFTLVNLEGFQRHPAAATSSVCYLKLMASGNTFDQLLHPARVRFNAGYKIHPDEEITVLLGSPGS